MNKLKLALLPISALVLSLVLAGCVNTDNGNQPKKKTLADISLNIEPAVNSSIERPQVKDNASDSDVIQLIIDYKELALLTDDPKVKQKIALRLAELQLIDDEHSQEVGSSVQGNTAGYFGNTIAAYQALLKKRDGGDNSEHLLYQLAKAYELQGEGELSYQTVKILTDTYPNSTYAKELHFRSGEYLFSQKKYALASDAYKHVVATDSKTSYFQTALYMLAWSEFKLEKETQALNYFSQLLDLQLPTQASNKIDLDKLPVASQGMVKDTLRVMSLIFSYQQGADSLVQHYQQYGARYYEYLNYESLAAQFIDEKRYQDSAQTYATFVERYPEHVKSPFYAITKIETYRRGRFPLIAVKEKQLFVRQFGVTGVHWNGWQPAYQQRIAPTLKSFIVELAQDNYRSAKQQKSATVKNQRYADAATWFLEYINTFNDDERMAYLYAESLYASEQFQAAIKAYQEYAYTPDANFVKARGVRADAAYNALIAYQKMSERLDHTAGGFAQVQQYWQASSQQFVDSFALDTRSLPLLEDIIAQKFTAKRYDDVIVSAQQMIDWPHSPTSSQIIDANIITAHSVFNLKRFEQSISAYENVLTMLQLQDKRLTDINENYAASMFRQAELDIAGDNMAQGIELFIAIIDKTPSSSVRKLAQYNAAQYLYQTKKYDLASEYLEDFRQRYASDELTKDIGEQLASLYEQQQNWVKAADEYLRISERAKPLSAQQAPLFIAASYYAKAKQPNKALVYFKRHAHAFEKPFERAIDVRFKLSELYLAQQDHVERLFWLKKLMRLNAKYPNNTTEHSTFLAAQSAMVFAADAHNEFNKIKLNLPLRRSLQRKTSSLKKSLNAYQKASDYNVAKFSTEASYQMAQIYRQLAQDLMDSQRPAGLDELALEQYEVLLEEQAFPFEDQAIALYENNSQRSWQGIFDQWVKKSFIALSSLLPGRYNKTEKIAEQDDVIL